MVHDAWTEYAPGTHSKYGLPVVKLALTAPPDLNATALLKTAVPNGFETVSWTTAPAGGLGEIVAVMEPV